MIFNCKFRGFRKRYFSLNGRKPELFFCLDVNKHSETRKQCVFCCRVIGEVGGHVILIVLLTVVGKLVSLSVQLFCFCFVFLLNIFDMVIWALQFQETENTLHQQANAAFCLLRRKINKRSRRARKTKLSAITRTNKVTWWIRFSVCWKWWRRDYITLAVEAYYYCVPVLIDKDL